VSCRWESRAPLPSFSIVTPALDQLEYLKVCVASVVLQGYPHVEHVVADGGSRDGTAEYLANSPGAVRIFRSEPDRGQSDALNWAISRCSGEWIGWQNADDFYLPGALWQVARAVEALPTVRAVIGDVVLVDADGVPAGTVGVAPVSSRRWLEGFWPYNQGVFLRRDLLAEIGPLDVDLRLHMDTDLLARIALVAPPVAYLDIPLGAFRKHGLGKTIGGAGDPESRRERLLLETRFGRRLWPHGPTATFAHRLLFHAVRAGRFGGSSLVRRWGDRLSRGAAAVVVS